MNWYKKAQNNYSIWLSEQINELTDGFTKDLPHPFDKNSNKEKNFEILETWINRNNPDLSNIGLIDAWRQAINYQYSQQNAPNEYDIETIKQNMNEFYAKSQNMNPNAPNFAVDIRIKKKAIPPSNKNKINKAIHKLGNFHTEIPLTEIFKICEENDRNGVAQATGF